MKKKKKKSTVNSSIFFIETDLCMLRAILGSRVVLLQYGIVYGLLVKIQNTSSSTIVRRASAKRESFLKLVFQGKKASLLLVVIRLKYSVNEVELKHKKNGDM